MAEFKIGQGNNRNTLLCYKVKKSLKIIVICLNYTGTRLKGLSLAKSGIM